MEAGLGVVAAGIEVVVQPPEIWAASVAVFSQDLSASEPALSCSVEHTELGTLTTPECADSGHHCHTQSRGPPGCPGGARRVLSQVLSA